MLLLYHIHLKICLGSHITRSDVTDANANAKESKVEAGIFIRSGAMSDVLSIVTGSFDTSGSKDFVTYATH